QMDVAAFGRPAELLGQQLTQNEYMQDAYCQASPRRAMLACQHRHGPRLPESQYLPGIVSDCSHSKNGLAAFGLDELPGVACGLFATANGFHLEVILKNATQVGTLQSCKTRHEPMRWQYS